jgi:CheY-like chemotaxis protein
MVRMVLSAMLRTLGLDAEAVASGEEALELLQSGAAFDVILLDVSMPGMSGEESLARIRALDQEVPVILISGFTSDGLNHLEGREAAGFLQKPFTRHDLEVAIRKAQAALHVLGSFSA